MRVARNIELISIVGIFFSTWFYFSRGEIYQKLHINKVEEKWKRIVRLFDQCCTTYDLAVAMHDMYEFCKCQEHLTNEQYPIQITKLLLLHRLTEPTDLSILFEHARIICPPITRLINIFYNEYQYPSSELCSLSNYIKKCKHLWRLCVIDAKNHYKHSGILELLYTIPTNDYPTTILKSITKYILENISVFSYNDMFSVYWETSVNSFSLTSFASKYIGRTKKEKGILPTEILIMKFERKKMDLENEEKSSTSIGVSPFDFEHGALVNANLVQHANQRLPDGVLSDKIDEAKLPVYQTSDKSVHVDPTLEKLIVISQKLDKSMSVNQNLDKSSANHEQIIPQNNPSSACKLAEYPNKLDRLVERENYLKLKKQNIPCNSFLVSPEKKFEYESKHSQNHSPSTPISARNLNKNPLFNISKNPKRHSSISNYSQESPSMGFFCNTFSVKFSGGREEILKALKMKCDSTKSDNDYIDHLVSCSNDSFWIKLILFLKQHSFSLKKGFSKVFFKRILKKSSVSPDLIEQIKKEFDVNF